MTKPVIFNFESGETGCEKAGPFGQFASKVIKCKQPLDITHDNNALAIFWGGSDIGTEAYGHQVSKHATNQKVSERDRNELGALQRCIEFNIPVIGICRGAQLLCVGVGGQLFQHVENHNNGSHAITIKNTGEVVKASSYHHQMMDLFQAKAEIIAFAKSLSNVHYTGSTDQTIGCDEEPEIVYFSQARGLAIQGHPEWDDPQSRYVKICLELVQERLLS